MIKVPSSPVIEGKDDISSGFEIVSPDAVFSYIDRREMTTAISKYPDDAGAGSVENYMVLLAATVIIEGKGAVRSGFKIITTNAEPRITLLIVGGEIVTLVADNPDSASARPVEDDVVQSATAAIIECKGAIPGGFEVIPGNAVPGVSLGIDWFK